MPPTHEQLRGCVFAIVLSIPIWIVILWIAIVIAT